MSEQNLIRAVRDGDATKVRELLEEGAPVDQQDENGWTPLNWAAGQGNVAALRLLLEHGADVTLTGRDNRTPLMIAKAAGRSEAAELLTEAEKKRGVWQDPRKTRLYCKAFYLADLEAFPGWPEEATAKAGLPRGTEEEGQAEEQELSIVYLHQDLTVTRSMWHGEDVVFDGAAADWQSFCDQQLQFAIPEDLL